MYSIENGQVYKLETGEGYEILSAFGPEYRVVKTGQTKSWEKFDLNLSTYIPAPECTEPFPCDETTCTETDILFATYDDMLTDMADRILALEGA